MVRDIDRMLELFKRDSNRPTRLGATLGTLLRIFAAKNDTANRSLAWLVTTVGRAFDLNQVQLYFDKFGRCCGHVIWACIPEGLSQKMRDMGSTEWPVEELSTIGDVWIMEFNALYGALTDILCAFNRRIPASAGAVCYSRSRRDRKMYRRVSRRAKWSSQSCPRGEPSMDDEWLMSSEESDGLRHSAAIEMDLVIRMGMAAIVLVQLPEYSAMSLSAFFNRVRNPIQRLQYRLYTSSTGEPIGFYTWAWMQSDELLRHGVKSLSALELGDWSEGLELFLCDAVANCVGLERMSQDLRGGWLPKQKLFVYPSVDGNQCEHLRVFDAKDGGRILPHESVSASGVYNLARALNGRDA